MKHLLVLVLMLFSWYLYVPSYTKGFDRFEIKPPNIPTGSLHCWGFERVDGKIIIACGTFYIREE